MMKKKLFIVSALLSCFALFLVGCDSEEDSAKLKDNLISGYDNLMQSFSKIALTSKFDLKGKKENGKDAYTGNYTAEYNKFNGDEFIFGATELQRKNGNNLKVTYTLEITEGTATLYWISSGDKRVIASETSSDEYKMTISSGDNYICLDGNKFSGSLELKVEDDEKE